MISSTGRVKQSGEFVSTFHGGVVEKTQPRCNPHQGAPRQFMAQELGGTVEYLYAGRAIVFIIQHRDKHLGMDKVARYFTPETVTSPKRGSLISCWMIWANSRWI